MVTCDIVIRDPSATPFQNIKSIFGDKLVLKSEQGSVFTDNAAADIECGICYIYKLHHETHGDQNPDVVCTNDQCNRGFHPSCLYEVYCIHLLTRQMCSPTLIIVVAIKSNDDT